MSFITDAVKYKNVLKSLLGIGGISVVQGDRPGFTYKIGGSTVMAAPGDGWVRLSTIGNVVAGTNIQFAASVNSLSPQIDVSDLWAAVSVGTNIRISPKLNTGVDYCTLRVTSKTSMDGGTWYLMDCEVLFVTPALPNSITGSFPVYVIDFQYDEGVRTDVNGNLIDETGAIISGIDKGTYAAMAIKSPTTNDGNYFHVTDFGQNGKPIRYQASALQGEWIPDGEQVVSDKLLALYVVFPDVQATAVADNGSGKCRITATAHLLTSGVCVPAGANGIPNVKLGITAGTNWTPGQYTILAVPDANSIDIDYPYVATLGTPTLAVKGSNLVIDAFTVPLPPLGKRTEVRVWARVAFTASTTSKQVKGYLDGTRFSQAIFNSAGSIAAVITQGFENYGSVSAQRSIFNLNMLGDSGQQTGNGYLDLAVNTSTSKNLTFDLQCVTANQMIGIDRLRIVMKGV